VQPNPLQAFHIGFIEKMPIYTNNMQSSVWFVDESPPILCGCIAPRGRESPPGLATVGKNVCKRNKESALTAPNQASIQTLKKLIR